MLHILGLLSDSVGGSGRAAPLAAASAARPAPGSGPAQSEWPSAGIPLLGSRGVTTGFPGRSLPGCSDDSHESRVTEGRKEQQHNVATNRKFFISKLNKKFDQQVMGNCFGISKEKQWSDDMDKSEHGFQEEFPSSGIVKAGPSTAVSATQV